MSALRCRLREADSRFDALPFDGALDRRAADTEELGDLEGAVLAAVYQQDEVSFLTGLSLGCLPRRRPLVLATFMPSRVRSRIRSDQLGNHGEDVEQQSSDRVGGVMDRPAEAQADSPGGEFVGDCSGVG